MGILKPRSRDKARTTSTVCVVGSGWRFTSGISYYTHRLATELFDAGTSVSALLMRGLIPRAFYPGRDRVGTAVHEVDYPNTMPVYDGVDWYWVPSIVGAVRFLRRQRPEYVVLQWWTGAVLHTYLLLALVARRSGAKIVIEMHEIQDTGEARMRGVGRYTSALFSRLIVRASACVVHSRHDEDALLKAHPSVRDIVHIIPHGPYDGYQSNPALKQVPDASARTGPLTVLFFGTIRPYKGLEHLVEAFDSLSIEEVAGLRLLIVGETWEGWTRPLELARASRHAERIEIVNHYVTDSEVSQVFSRADAVALPYLRSSASGPLHIAMANGLPVVLADVGGLRDGAGGYKGIVWVEPGDTAGLRAALLSLASVVGQRYADERSWADSVAAYSAIFANLAV